MRLSILDHGHGWSTKLLFGVIRLFSRQPVLDVVKLVRYRPEFHGNPMGRVTQLAMRGDSPWSVGDRELMAAVVAKANACEFCTRAHAAVAGMAFDDRAKVDAVLEDLERAPVDPPLRATLSLLWKLSREHALTASDVRRALAAGATREQLQDAFAVHFAFSVTARLADAFGFDLATPAAMTAGAKYLLSRGYG